MRDLPPTKESGKRHILHIEPEGDEWRAWCCCGWASHTWRAKEAVRTAAATHVSYVNSLLR